MSPATRLKNRFKLWFYEGIRESATKPSHTHQDAWWKVMCLTGVDYFSTLGYQPGIAFLAAGILSPLATLVLVLLTLVGALPVYARVAEESPNGQGSLYMLADLLPKWKGKTFILCLLGFAATDFVITITLSAADAAAHLVQNPLVPHWMQNQMLITLVLLTLLAAIFLKGFREAIDVAFILVVVYLILNIIVIFTGFQHINPDMIFHWDQDVNLKFGSPVFAFGASLLLFPKLALGLSGFETGVAVMPHVSGEESDTHEVPTGRIKNTKFLLATAAVLMSFYLIGSSLVTTLLIPAAAFKEGGEANGRALAYLAHDLLGNTFGTIYDLSTIAILWFAGASAMAGLLNLVPRYLPRYGMAPEWARAVRPLVLFFTVVSFAVTIIFNANVDAQGGAYATGVLVLMTSAALAVSLSSIERKDALWKRVSYALITLVFIYTTVSNCFQRPDGLKIASFFIVTILVTSLISRALRAVELRVHQVCLDGNAWRFIEEAAAGTVRIVAHRPGGPSDYKQKEAEARETHNITDDLIFLEVRLDDASEFHDDVLEVRGVWKDNYKVLECECPAVPNAIAALLLHIRDVTRKVPHLYCGWTEGNPLIYVLKFLFFGEGETAPVTREILREVERDPASRPRVHVG